MNKNYHGQHPTKTNTKLISLAFALAFLSCLPSHETKAATFNLGNFPGSSSFGDADANSAPIQGYNLLPSNGNFKDDWNFTVSQNNGGSSNVAITGIGQVNIDNLAASIGGLGFSPLYKDSTNELIGLNFGILPVGNYTLTVTGSLSASNATHSYSGNLIIDTPKVAATPLPAAFWMFGVGVVALTRACKK